MSTKLSKSILAALLISSLPRLTIPAAEPAIVGQVIGSRGASLGGIPIPGAGTILAGDVLATDHSGRALVSLSSGDRLNVDGDTSIKLERQRGAVVARISRGDLLAEAPRPGSLAVETSQYRIASEAGPASCLVAVLPNRRTLVSARQGRIAVTDLRSGVITNLATGEQVAMAAPVVPGQEPEPSQPAPPKAAGQAPPPGAPAQPSTVPAQPATPPEPSTPSAPGPSGPTTTPTASHGSNTVLILLVAGAGIGAAAGIAAASGGGHGGGGGAPVSPSAP